MMNVWLAEKNVHGISDVFGVYAYPADAKQRCQNDAAEYFGHAPPLKWLGNEDYCSASHYDPRGNAFYQVTRFEVKEDC